MRIIFMGTPFFAVPSLKALTESKHNVAAIVTKIDKPSGRGYQITQSPVKKVASECKIPILQPKSIKTPEFEAELKGYNPDIIIVSAYGKILPKNILDLPSKGCYNIHASLLPKYRGAAPIHWALVNGEKETGITIMKMVEELDAGDIILTKKIYIEENDNVGTLHTKLSHLGAEAIIEALELIESGKAIPIPQDLSKSTFAPMIKKSDGAINWSYSSDNIINLIRGMNPWPGAYCNINTKMIKVLKAQKCEEVHATSFPGIVVKMYKDEGPVIKTGDGAVVLLEVQPENKKVMSGKDFINGSYVHIADICGKVVFEQNE